MNELLKGSFFWVKLMTDDVHAPAECVEIKSVMNFKFFNGVCVPCELVTDYKKCVYE
jgi:hypothetical protein|tara:strand:+ start:413 stop:583 length:171 start_codon:yes stop_codon:yes gene_type:complete